MHWSHRVRNSTSTRRTQRCRNHHCRCGCRPANLKNRSSLCRYLRCTSRKSSSSGHQQSTHLPVSPSSRSTLRLSGRAIRSDKGHEHRPPRTNCTSGRIRSRPVLGRTRRYQEISGRNQHLHRTQQQLQRLCFPTHCRSGSRESRRRSHSSRCEDSLQTSIGRRSTPSHSRSLGSLLDHHTAMIPLPPQRSSHRPAKGQGGH